MPSAGAAGDRRSAAAEPGIAGGLKAAVRLLEEAGGATRGPVRTHVDQKTEQEQAGRVHDGEADQTVNEATNGQ